MTYEEVRHIPPSKIFSSRDKATSRDKAKIISSVIKAIPKEYMDQFSPAAEAPFGAMQASLLDVSVGVSILLYILEFGFSLPNTIYIYTVADQGGGMKTLAHRCDPSTAEASTSGN